MTELEKDLTEIRDILNNLNPKEMYYVELMSNLATALQPHLVSNKVRSFEFEAIPEGFNLKIYTNG